MLIHSKKYFLVLLFLVLVLLACPKSKTGGGGTESGEGSIEGGGNGSNGNGGKDGLQTARNPKGWGLGGPADPSIEVERVDVDEAGNLYLALNQSTRIVNHYMWLADSRGDADDANNRGMVSKFDMRTRREVARYLSVSNIRCDASQSPEKGECTLLNGFSFHNYYPSRTAIDREGNAWIANRGGSGRPGVLTKIAGNKSACKNGGARTSEESNNLQVFDDDDCVLFSTPVCERDSGTYAQHEGARALAIDGRGNVWVGCYREQAAYKFDSKTGRQLAGPIPLGMHPYGAIVDGAQNLWLTDVSSSHIQGLDTLLPEGETFEGEDGGIQTPAGLVAWRNIVRGWSALPGNSPVPIAPTGIAGCGAYGLAVDRHNRVWMSSWTSNDIVACFYKHDAPEGSRWGRCDLAADGYSSGRGIAVDKADNVYMSSNNTGRLTRFYWEDAGKRCHFRPMRGHNTVELGISGNLLGVGFDAYENPWTVALGSQAARVNLYDEDGEAIVGGDLVSQTIASPGYSPSYYTYSDFTGYQLRNFAAPRGFYRQVIEGCQKHTFWKSVSWEALVPSGTTLSVFVRTGDTREEWDKASFRPVENISVNGNHFSADLDLDKSTFLQLEFLLESPSGQDSPKLRSYEVKWACAHPERLLQ